MAEKPQIPSTLAELPPLPQHQIPVWETLCTRMSDCPSRAGLYLMLSGWSYREAARAVGIQYATLMGCVDRYGLREALHRTDRVIANHRAIAISTTEEIIERARDDKLKDESVRDLAVTAGISSDKVRDWEKQQQQPTEALSLLRKIASDLVSTGARLDISVSPVTPPDKKAAVDVEIVADCHTPAERPHELES